MADEVIGLELDTTGVQQGAVKAGSAFDQLEYKLKHLQETSSLDRLAQQVRDLANITNSQLVKSFQEAQQRVESLRNSLKDTFGVANMTAIKEYLNYLNRMNEVLRNTGQVQMNAFKGSAQMISQINTQLTNYYRTILQVQSVLPNINRLQTGVQSGSIAPNLSGSMFAGASLVGKISPQIGVPAQIGDMSNALKGLGSDFMNATSGAKSFAGSVDNVGRSMLVAILQGAIIRRMFFELIQVIREGVTEMLDAGRQFANIDSILPRDTSIEPLRNGLIELDAQFGKTSDLAKGMYQAISGGVPVKDVLDFINVSAKAAGAGLASIFDTVDAGTTVMNAFDLSGKDANKIYNDMFQTVALGKVQMPQLAKEIGIVSNVAYDAGVSLDEMFASIATSSRSQRPERAIQGLRAALSDIIKPTKQAEDEASKLGISFNDAAVKSQGFLPFLENIREKVNGDNEALGKLFGSSRALTFVLSVTGQNAKTAAADLNIMNASIDQMSEGFNKQRQSLGAQLDALSVNFEKGLIHTFGLLEPLLAVVLQILNNYPSVFTALIVAVTAATIAFAAMNVQALFLSGNAGSALLGMLMQIQYAILGLGSAAEMSAGAMALSAGTIGLVVAAIGLLGYGIYTAIENYNKLNIATDDEIISLQKQIQVMDQAKGTIASIQGGTQQFSDSQQELINAYNLLDPAARAAVRDTNTEAESIRVLNEELAKELALRRQQQAVQGGDLVYAFQKQYQEYMQMLNNLRNAKADLAKDEQGDTRDHFVAEDIERLKKNVDLFRGEAEQMEKDVTTTRNAIKLFSGGTREGGQAVFDMATALHKSKGNFDDFFSALTDATGHENIFKNQADASTRSINAQTQAFRNLADVLKDFEKGNTDKINERIGQAIEYRREHPEQTRTQMIKALGQEPEFAERTAEQRRINDDRNDINKAFPSSTPTGSGRTPPVTASFSLLQEIENEKRALERIGKETQEEKNRDRIDSGLGKSLTKQEQDEFAKFSDKTREYYRTLGDGSAIEGFVLSLRRNQNSAMEDQIKSYIDLGKQEDAKTAKEKADKVEQDLQNKTEQSFHNLLDSQIQKIRELSGAETELQMIERTLRDPNNLKYTTEENQERARGNALIIDALNLKTKFDQSINAATSGAQDQMVSLQQGLSKTDPVEKLRQQFAINNAKIPEAQNDAQREALNSVLRMQDEILSLTKQTNDARAKDENLKEWAKLQQDFEQRQIKILDLTKQQSFAIDLQKGKYGNLTEEQKQTALAQSKVLDYEERIHVVSKDVEKTFSSAFEGLFEKGPQAFFDRLVKGFENTLAKLLSDWLASKVRKVFLQMFDKTFLSADGQPSKLPGLAGGATPIAPSIASQVQSFINPANGGSAGAVSTGGDAVSRPRTVTGYGTSASSLLKMSPGINLPGSNQNGLGSLPGFNQLPGANLLNSIPGLGGNKSVPSTALPLSFKGPGSTGDLSAYTPQNNANYNDMLDSTASTASTAPLAGMGGMASAGILSAGGIAGAFAGGDSQTGRLLGMAGGTATAGAAAGAGLFGGGIAALMPALFSNPITAVAAGGLIGGALLMNLMSDGVQKQLRDATKSVWQIDIRDDKTGNNLLTQMKQMGEQVLGPGKASGHAAEIVQYDNVKAMIEQYGEETGQKNNPLVAAHGLTRSSNSLNQFITPVTGARGTGGIFGSNDYLVGEHGPEVASFGSSGYMYSSVQDYISKMLPANYGSTNNNSGQSQSDSQQMSDIITQNTSAMQGIANELSNWQSKDPEQMVIRTLKNNPTEVLNAAATGATYDPAAKRNFAVQSGLGS